MYLRPSNRGHSTRGVWIAGGAIIIFVIFGFLFDRLAFMLGGPLWNVRSGLVSTVETFTSYLSSKSSLERKVGELQKSIDEKNMELLSVKDKLGLYAELDSYIAQADVKANQKVVQVVTRPPQTPYDELIAKTDAETCVGQRAFFADILVGSVTSCSGSYARISLLSHPESQFRALIGPKKIEGDAKGKGNGNIMITLPKSTDIQVGDIVYMAEDSLPFGTVQNIDNSASQSFEDVYVALPFSPQNIDWLTFSKE